MIVIKPVDVKNASLVSSTIPEPDAAQGEIEFAIVNKITDAGSAATRFSSNGGAVFHGINPPYATVKRYDASFDADGFSFSISSEDTSAEAIAETGDNIYVVGAFTDTIYEYTKAGVYTGFSFPVVGSVTSMVWDGSLFNVTTLNSETIATYNILGTRMDDWVAVGDGSIIGAVGYDFNGMNYYALDLISKYVYQLTAKRKLTGAAWFYNQVGQIDDSSGVSTFVNISGVMHLALYSGFAIFPFVFVDRGERYIRGFYHSLYESLEATADDPFYGASKENPSWARVGPTNKYSAFDAVISNQSISQLTQEVEIKPGYGIGGLAAFNLTGIDSITVVMTDPVFGIAYYETYALTDKTDFVILDLPDYPDATTKVTFTGAGEIGVGALVLGPIAVLGETNYGTSVQQLDFSVYKEDSFGNVQVIKRPSAKLVNFKNTVQKEDLSYVYQQLNELTGVAAVWVGDETNTTDFTLVYGSHRDNTLNIDSPTACSVPIQIRGRV